MEMNFTHEALKNIAESGVDPAEDVAAIRSGQHTRDSLLAHCLDGAEPDREEGWRDYVDSVCAAAEVH